MRGRARAGWFLLLLLAIATIACGGGGGGAGGGAVGLSPGGPAPTVPTTSAPPVQTVGPTTAAITLRLSQPALRVASSEITQVRVTGTSNSEAVVFGPETRDRAAEVSFLVPPTTPTCASSWRKRRASPTAWCRATASRSLPAGPLGGLPNRSVMRPAEVVKLCAEVGAMESSEEAAQHFLVSTLRLIGAPMASLMWSRPATGFYEPGTGLLAGVDERTARDLHSFYGEGECVRDPHNRALRALAPGVEARTRRETVHDSDWYANGHVAGRRECGFDDVVTCGRTVPQGQVFLSLHRGLGERPFSEDERDDLTLLTRCGAWLLTRLVSDGFLGPITQALPPRLSRALELLLTGLSEREMASELGLSANTVHKYVENLYRHFGVQSRPELMALLLPPPVRRVYCPSFYSAL